MRNQYIPIVLSPTQRVVATLVLTCLDYTTDGSSESYTRIDLMSTSSFGAGGNSDTCDHSAGMVLCVEQATSIPRVTH